MRFKFVILLALLCGSCKADHHSTTDKPEPEIPETPSEEPDTPSEPTIDLSKWDLAWSDEFDSYNYNPATDIDNDSFKAFDTIWESAEETTCASHIIGTRHRANVEVSDGTLKLHNRNESKIAGAEFTNAYIWTKKKFHYGYYESRYKYADSPGINNAFWLMEWHAKEGLNYEIDINEGRYPNKITMNLHDWSNGNKTWPEEVIYGSRPDYSFQLETPIKTQRVRLRSNYPSHFHIPEFRVYSVTKSNYPDPLSKTADTDIANLVNYVRTANTTIEVSGTYDDSANRRPERIADGNISTTWTTQTDGEKWLIVDFGKPVDVGCIQFLNGYLNASKEWTGQITDFTVEYMPTDSNDWVVVSSMNNENSEINLSKNFHNYGLEWSKDALKFYFDGKVIYEIDNTFCYDPSEIRFSTAVFKWLTPHPTEDNFMEVDYVRYYTPKNDTK